MLHADKVSCTIVCGRIKNTAWVYILKPCSHVKCADSIMCWLAML